jgi:transcriptional regulator with XRE-family HTH domain
MANSRGQREANRALALGALLRKRRRECGYTLDQLARRIPMSPSNLSRLELGSQGPPADEVIERIATALGGEPGEFLQAAGRWPGLRAARAREARCDGRDLREVRKAIARLMKRR